MDFKIKEKIGMCCMCMALLSPTIAEPVYAQIISAPSPIDNVPGIPSPMAFSRAKLYQEAHSEDIHYRTYDRKDEHGNKTKVRVFDLLGEGGLVNHGEGFGDYTSLRFTIQYGNESTTAKPVACIGWGAHLAGNPRNGYEPHYMRIVFRSGQFKEIPLQGWEYETQVQRALFSVSVAHWFHGTIALSNVDLYEISQMGEVDAIYVDDGLDNARHFFYSGEKQKDEKAQFTRGICHAVKILDVDVNTVRKEIQATENQAEIERKAKLREEILQEIKEEEERAAMKKEILKEMGREAE